jgi:putative ABC transport system permease protein
VKLLDTFLLALRSIRSTGLRSALTLGGIVIGVFAIVSSVTAVRVVEAYFEEAFSHVSAASVTVTRLPLVERVDPELEKRPALTYEQFARLREGAPPSVGSMSLQTTFDFGAIEYRDRETNPNVLVFGSDEHYALNYGFDVVEGRPISAAEVHHRRRVVLLGQEVARALFPNGGGLGEEVRFAGGRFRVVGVLSERGSFLGWSQDAYVVAPVTTLLAVYGNAHRDVGRISVLAEDPARLSSVVDWLYGRLRVLRRLGPAEDNDFEVTMDRGIQESIAGFAGMLTTGGLVLGLITLVTAAIGVTNVMLVSVVERTREIGVQKALGARRRDVLLQFVFEALLLCQAGGLLGVVAGVALGNGVAVWLGLRLALPWGWVLAALVIVSAVAVVASAYPAFRAARLDPIESLRYE